MKSISALQLIILLCMMAQNSEASIKFNRTSTGVVFSQYVKGFENGVIPGWMTYTVEDVVTMMKVVSTKFTRIATYGVGANNVEYGPNTYNTSNAAVFAAEAAALLNLKRKTLAITALVGIWQADSDVQMDAEGRLALESAQVANNLYPGTVEGIVFSHSQIGTDESRAQQTLEQIQLFKDRIHELGLKVGSRQKCNTGSKALKEIRRRIVNESDFIICELDPALHNMQAGPEAGLVTVRDDLLVLRKEFQGINPNIEVMGQTGWASKGQKWENVENMKNYWKVVDQWAAENGFTMWMFEAFDCPWKTWTPDSPNYGWWKLRRNEDTGKVAGYAEKIYEPPEEEEKPLPTCVCPNPTPIPTTEDME